MQSPGCHRFHARARPRIVLVVVVGVATAASACHRTGQSDPARGTIERGRAAIDAAGCGVCHEIDGVQNAHGDLAPSLSGVGSRAIVAGTLPNTPENVLRWIINPQAIQPGVAMPPLGNVNAETARDVVAYLESLR